MKTKFPWELCANYRTERDGLAAGRGRRVVVAWRVIGVCAAGLTTAVPARAADPLVVQSVRLDRPTVHALGVQALISDDDNRNARVDVRYRVVGGAFRDGAPLFRVRPETVTGRVVPAQFAGSLFDLAPGTDYEIELHFVDPDGVDQRQTLMGRTRTVPADPRTPRVVNVTTAVQLRSALGAAQPGDVITLADGTYLGSFSITAGGAADNPIVVRGQSQAGTILDGQNCTDCNVFDVGGNFVHVEQMTMQNAVRGLAFGTGATEGGVARRLRVQNVVHGIAAQAAVYRDLFFCDNVIEGRLRWPWVFDADATSHWDDRGISIRGDGHVICHNRISGFGDSITQREAGSRSFDYYGNDIGEAWDGSEVDSAEGNARVWGNRWTNVQLPVSIQPILGGPAYMLRNVSYNVTEEQIKLKMTGSEPSGLLAYHNTFVSPKIALNLQTPITGHNFVIANNLFVGPAQPTASVVEWTAGIDGGLFDYNGYYPNGRFWLGKVNGQNVVGNNFAELQSRAIFETHGILLALPIFASGLTAPADFMAQATPPVSFAPALSSNALDKGQRLVGFNASAQGAGPDLGAWESGCPAPMYGPRPIGQESYFTPVDGCSATGGTGGAAGAGGTAGTGGAAGTGGTAGAGGMAGMGAMAGTSGAGGAGGMAGVGGAAGAGASAGRGGGAGASGSSGGGGSVDGGGGQGGGGGGGEIDGSAGSAGSNPRDGGAGSPTDSRTSGGAGCGCRLGGGQQRSGAAFLSMFLIAAAAATRRARERAKSAL